MLAKAENRGTMHQASMGRSQKLSLKQPKICRSKSRTPIRQVIAVTLALVKK